MKKGNFKYRYNNKSEVVWEHDTNGKCTMSENPTRYAIGIDPCHRLKWHQNILRFLGFYKRFNKSSIVTWKINPDGSKEILKRN